MKSKTFKKFGTTATFLHTKCGIHLGRGAGTSTFSHLILIVAIIFPCSFRYDVMYGVTQSESFHLLNAATLTNGLTENERNRIIRTYVRNSYASNIDQVTAAILNEYTVKAVTCSLPVSAEFLDSSNRIFHPSFFWLAND